MNMDISNFKRPEAESNSILIAPFMLADLGLQCTYESEKLLMQMLQQCVDQRAWVALPIPERDMDLVPALLKAELLEQQDSLFSLADKAKERLAEYFLA
jgi:hypothetical protein